MAMPSLQPDISRSRMANRERAMIAAGMQQQAQNALRTSDEVTVQNALSGTGRLLPAASVRRSMTGMWDAVVGGLATLLARRPAS